ncbi:MAG: nucleotidyltransferase family protein [Cyclobacteriaceae bacterium]|nr:nucleotidyltransferase family protein [Cyclobacteriaceae bacterium]
MSNTIALILAAGNSSRLGSPKQLLPYKGTTLLNNLIEEIYKSKVSGLYVVLGALKEQILPTLPSEIEKLESITNPGWSSGMGSSIKVGVNYILKCNPLVNSIIITVSDQPFVTASVFNSLMNKAISEPAKSIVACQYGKDMYGVPVLFKKELFNELLSIEDNTGAKQLIRENKPITTFVKFPEGAIDIDTEDDLHKILPEM